MKLRATGSNNGRIQHELFVCKSITKTSQKQDIGTPATLDYFRASILRFFRNTLYTPVLGGRLAADGGTVQTPAGYDYAKPIYSSSPWYVAIMKHICKFAGLFYYLLDNMVWVANVGIVHERFFNKIYYKQIKDVFNLIRKFTQFLLSMIIFSRERYKE